MLEHLGVEVGVQDQLADLGSPDEALAVEARSRAPRASAASVSAGKSSRVSGPRAPSRRPRAPATSHPLTSSGVNGSPSCFDLDVPRVAGVLDPERDRLRGRAGEHGDAEACRPRCDPPSATFVARTAGPPDSRSARAAYTRRAAQAGNAAVNAIQRDEPDDAQAAHARSRTARVEGEGERERGQRCPDRWTHPRRGAARRGRPTTPGPVGWIHW